MKIVLYSLGILVFLCSCSFNKIKTNRKSLKNYKVNTIAYCPPVTSNLEEKNIQIKEKFKIAVKKVLDEYGYPDSTCIEHEFINYLIDTSKINTLCRLYGTNSFLLTNIWYYEIIREGYFNESRVYPVADMTLTDRYGNVLAISRYKTSTRLYLSHEKDNSAIEDCFDGGLRKILEKLR